MTDERARVEALARACRRHTQSSEGGICQECVLAFAAAQRAEELKIIATHAKELAALSSSRHTANALTFFADAISDPNYLRARREGPG